MTETQPSRRAAVYRLYDAAGSLLYIGSAYDPEQRCKAHRRTAWWPGVPRRADEWHPTRWRAYEEEVSAIAAEEPTHNVMGTDAYRAECKRLAAVDPARRAKIRAGSAAGNGAPGDVVEAILQGDLKSYSRRTGPVAFE
ncbi:GIY-YIG nuclease family protein [Streptomyces sp. NPDC005148]